MTPGQYLGCQVDEFVDPDPVCSPIPGAHNRGELQRPGAAPAHVAKAFDRIERPG